MGGRGEAARLLRFLIIFINIAAKMIEGSHLRRIAALEARSEKTRALKQGMFGYLAA
jgi:hypothetical protein